MFNCRNQAQIFFDCYFGHIRILLFRGFILLVENAVIMKPSSCNSRYTTIRHFFGSNSRTDRRSPSPPTNTQAGFTTVSSTSKRIPDNSQCSSIMCAYLSSVNLMGVPFFDVTDSIIYFPTRGKLCCFPYAVNAMLRGNNKQNLCQSSTRYPAE